MKTFIRTALLSLVCFVVINVPGYCQGLNNDHKIDETDLKAIFEMQNIEVFKFPFDQPDSVKYVNLIIEEYKDGKRKTLDFYRNEKVKPIIAAYGKQIIVSNIQKGMENILRLYLKRSDTTLLVHFILNQQQPIFDFSFSPELKMFGSRAFSVDYKSLKKRTRILSFYGTKNADQPMHCAMEDDDLTLSKRFDYVLSVYIEEF
jgi:hypothetical protein